MRKLGSVAAWLVILVVAGTASAGAEPFTARSIDLRGSAELVADGLAVTLAADDKVPPSLAIQGEGIKLARYWCFPATPGSCQPDEEVTLDSGEVTLQSLQGSGRLRLDTDGIGAVESAGARIEPGAGATFWDPPSATGMADVERAFAYDPASGGLEAELAGAMRGVLVAGELAYSGRQSGADREGTIGTDGSDFPTTFPREWYILITVSGGEAELAGRGLAAAIEGRVAGERATVAAAEGNRDYPEATGFTVSVTEVDGESLLALGVISPAEVTPAALEEERDATPLDARRAAEYGAIVVGVGAIGATVWYWPTLRWAGTVLLLPLYSRIERGSVMEHETRERIYSLVKDTPGIHAHEIAAKAGVGWGTAVYHLKMLEDHRLVVSERQGRYKRFFLAAGFTGTKDAIGAMRNATTAAVAEFIAANPGAIQREVCTALGLSPSLVSWHIEKLEGADLVKKVREGRTVKYFAGPAWNAVAPQVVTVDPAAAVNN